MRKLNIIFFSGMYGSVGFTRTVCAMWAISLLDVFIHIQLNILGRHVYLDTAKNMSKSKVQTRKYVAAVMQ